MSIHGVETLVGGLSHCNGILMSVMNGKEIKCARHWIGVMTDRGREELKPDHFKC